jgi:hypothetical protein
MPETEKDRLNRQYGLDVATVGESIEQETGPSVSHADAPAGSEGGPILSPNGPPPGTPFVMPVLDGYPVDFPGEGIFFGMSDEDYHAIPAFSNSGFKAFAASPMLFWAKSAWLSPDFAEWKREQQEKREKEGADHFDIGHAYECRVLEGREAFLARFGVALDKKDFPDALVTVEDIENAAGGMKLTGRSKREKFESLLRLDPDAQLWEDIKAAHEADHAGKYLVPAKVHRQLEIAAAMLEKDPEIGPIISTGQPQVVLCWIDAATGVPMKMKADLLKVKLIADMKTIANQKEMCIENAIRFEIANRRYPFQVRFYCDGAAAVREIVRKHGARAVHSCDLDPEPGPISIDAHQCRVEWALKWAQHMKRDQFLFIFQQKGHAPVARGLTFPIGGTMWTVAGDMVRSAINRFRVFAETFGTDPWLDVKPIYDLHDDDLPSYAVDI